MKSKLFIYVEELVGFLWTLWAWSELWLWSWSCVFLCVVSEQGLCVVYKQCVLVRVSVSEGCGVLVAAPVWCCESRQLCDCLGAWEKGPGPYEVGGVPPRPSCWGDLCAPRPHCHANGCLHVVELDVDFFLFWGAAFFPPSHLFCGKKLSSRATVWN